MLPLCAMQITLTWMTLFTSAQARVSQTQISEFNNTVDGRLFAGRPFVMPCTMANGANSTTCQQIQTNYTDEVFRSTFSGAYINTQWETCQRTGAQCLLDYTDSKNLDPVLPPNDCQMGSVPSYFVNVSSVKHVQAAFNFSKQTKMPLVIKNTGHDYKGRSSAPQSLALWTHNLKNISYDANFTPDGCPASSSTPGVTLGAGIQFKDAYAFAESNNITIVGGSDRSVGAGGGWLLGGGHSMLSNTMGLGADRALQFKVVTPDGQYRTANACQNSDLYFALRGGGGATFGVVIESTVRASPQITVQVVIVSFTDPNPDLTKQLWTVMTSNALQWAEEGWGGIATSQIAVYVNPKLDADAAATSMAPLIQFGQGLVNSNVTGAQIITTEFPSWGTFFDFFTSENVAIVGANLALSSRLINKANFETPANQTVLVDAMLNASAIAPRLIILISTPYSYPGDGQTSFTDAWRSSVYHITVSSTWNYNATAEEKRGRYEASSKAIDNLRKITPVGAYQNEADVYEPNHEESFWGSHYSRLLEIKRKYDPHHLLDCWQCVGSEGPKAKQFSCYL